LLEWEKESGRFFLSVLLFCVSMHNFDTKNTDLPFLFKDYSALVP